MNRIRYMVSIILLLFLLVIGEVEAFAVNTGFSTESIPEEDAAVLLRNVNITMLTAEPQKKSIECFDVNEEGRIAIGCGSSKAKTVCIYSSDGIFEYGYRFDCSGSFGIELDSDVLIICLVRSDAAIAVNSAGEVESVLRIQNTSENNSYWNEHVYSTVRKVGDVEYALGNNMGILNVFASSYSQLTATDINGEARVLYDVNSTQLLHTALAVIGVVALAGIAVTVIVRQTVKHNRNARKQASEV